MEQSKEGALRKKRLVPGRRIRKGFRLELALNQDLRLGTNEKKGHCQRREWGKCRKGKICPGHSERCHLLGGRLQ